MILYQLITLNYYHLVLVVDMWGVNKVEFFVKCGMRCPTRLAAWSSRLDASGLTEYSVLFNNSTFFVRVYYLDRNGLHVALEGL